MVEPNPEKAASGAEWGRTPPQTAADNTRIDVGTMPSSNVISGIVIVVVVGILILYFRDLFGSRRYAGSLQREFTLLERQLLYVTKTIVNFTIEDIEKPPTAMSEVYEFVKSKPIDVYYKYLKDKRPELSNLKTYETSFLEYRAAANNLSSLLNYLIRTYNSSRGKMAETDRYLYIYFVGNLLNFPEFEIFRLMGLSPANSDWIIQGYARIIQNEPLMQMCRVYLDKKQQLETSFVAVRSLLHQIPH